MAGASITNSLLVFLGAGLGGNLRYWLGEWIGARHGTAFPWATLAVNLAGSLAIGLFMALFARLQWPVEWRLFLAVGVLGGFTTFSAFSFETMQLVQSKAYVSAVGYVVASLVFGILGCTLGWALGSALVRAKG